MSETGPALRASDDDRERVARLLGEHAAAGRLSPDELDERVDAAYAARTQAELDALLGDLPAVPGPPPPDAEHELAKSRLAHRAGLAVIAIVLCVAIWAASGREGSFWPVWVILVAGIGLARDAWRALGPGRGLRDEQLGEHRPRGLERRGRRP